MPSACIKGGDVFCWKKKKLMEWFRIGACGCGWLKIQILFHFQSPICFVLFATVFCAFYCCASFSFNESWLITNHYHVFMWILSILLAHSFRLIMHANCCYTHILVFQRCQLQIKRAHVTCMGFPWLSDH